MTMGVYLGYALAQYCEFYPIDHVMILGRVSKGAGGMAFNQKCLALNKKIPVLSTHLRFGLEVTSCSTRPRRQHRILTVRLYDFLIPKTTTFWQVLEVEFPEYATGWHLVTLVLRSYMHLWALIGKTRSKLKSRKRMPFQSNSMRPTPKIEM